MHSIGTNKVRHPSIEKCDTLSIDALKSAECIDAIIDGSVLWSQFYDNQQITKRWKGDNQCARYKSASRSRCKVERKI